MNRYIVEGIINDWLEHGNVLVVAPSEAIARNALDHVARALPNDESKVYVSNGNLRIVNDIGTIRFRSAQANLRGLTANVLVVLDPRAIRGVEDGTGVYKDLKVITALADDTVWVD